MLQRVEHDNGVVTYQSPLLREVGVIHAFSTRIGGVSVGPFASLNLGSLAKRTAPDENILVSENYRRFRRALGAVKLRRVEVNQVHGCEVWHPPAKPIRPADAPQADAMISQSPGAMLTVRTADCVPILLSDLSGRSVAAVHAGWRSVVAGVVSRTINALRKTFNVEPHQLIAAIGPSIGVDHFEVGEEVASAFEQAGLSSTIDRSRTKPHIDLRSAVRQQLLTEGLEPANIDTTDRCTYRDADEFFSHRRDNGLTGRMAAIIVARQATSHV